MSEVSMERCLLEMAHVILFEIFRRLPKDKLIEISRLRSKFRDTAGDTRLWKDVYIHYHPNQTFAFEDLYSEPWPVKVIDLFGTKINPPVSLQTDQIVEVNKLDLSSIKVDEVTMEAILAKYQCTELYMNFSHFTINNIYDITPEAFSKQTALKALTIGNIDGARNYHRVEKVVYFQQQIGSWLAQILDNCKNLKTLCLHNLFLSNFAMLRFVKSLPTSLEKLVLIGPDNLDDSFFKLLAEKSPNLKELHLSAEYIKCPSLLGLQFLEALHVFPQRYADISDLYMYLIKFPALKTMYCVEADEVDSPDPHLETLRAMLEPRGIIIVKRKEESAHPYCTDMDGPNVWKVPERVPEAV